MAVLPEWLTPLPDAAQMRAIDRWAIEVRGVAGIDLMERAGTAVTRAVERLAPDGAITVLCGKGNNGGDGLVVARQLRHAGRRVHVVCTAAPDEFSGDARENLERLPGEPPLRLDGTPWGAARDAAPVDLFDAAAVVDALLGTGFAGEPHGEPVAAIEALNAASTCVVSVDVPSGVDASSGVVSGAAVRAHATVSFHAGKPGLWVTPGKEHAGEVEIADIGIPRGAPCEAAIGLIDSAVLELIPRRRASWTKFKSGHVLVVGGSRGLAGAPRLSALAGMRAGAGYVTACVPASIEQVLAAGATPEIMTRGLPEENGGLIPEALQEVLDASERGGALALGPGLGRGGGAQEFARALAREARVPMVLDADGLGAHAGRLAELRARGAGTVLTPHAGELARLLECSSTQIARERLRHVRDAAERSGAVTLLKGDDTLIAEPGGRVAVSRGATPALASAGTGDVLTGVIAALLAQGLEPFAAAAAGAFLHAQAGKEAARRLGLAEGVIASDVIAALPAARARALGAAQDRPDGAQRAVSGA